jgi:chromate reductase, NAD(P)H dehydrogenase (quinone)
MPNVAVLVGSLRKESHNRKLAFALEKLAAGKLALSQVDISDLPMFNEDLLSAGVPAPVARFKREVGEADALLFITPEYNRLPSAVLKNAIDWASRPYGTNSFLNKPAAMAGMSLGNIGTAVAQSTLRTSLLALDVRLMGLPELYLTYREGIFDPQYRITDDGLRTLLSGFVDKFAAWISKG